ncbi:MAG: hypothetical protein IKP31_02105 [Lachnospiraceae bacterium]|nr:hypothetical protein [Lachnospiraceae bacterium]
MRRLIRSFKNNNKGSAIVVVIIALAFVGILAVTAMWLSMSNYRMKATDKGIKGNFYTAETVFEQIVAGLQGESSEAAAVAYRKVLQNYVSASGDEERYSRFVKFYKEELINRLHDTTLGATARYDKTRIRSYLDPVLQTRLDPTSPADGNKFEMTGVMEMSADNYDFITLKGFKLEFTDDNGYYSVIETDIMITAPKVSFTMSSSMPEVFKYAIIADTGLEKTVGTVTNINGNIYIGEEGMNLAQGSINIDNADYVISMGPVKVTDSSASLKIGHTDSDVNTQFWAQDIDISSSNRRTMTGGEIDIDADTYVADDLTLEAPGCNVKLVGTYRGYGNSTTNAAKSSAVMVNSLNSNIDMSGLSDLTLAGYSFISLSSYYRDPATRKLFDEISTGQVSANDIGMGESIAVKSDQVAFLIPEECLWVLPGKQTTSCSRNPVDYNDIVLLFDEKLGNHEAATIAAKVTSGESGQSGKELYQVMLDKELENGETLRSYVNSTADITRVYSAYGTGGRLVYYYMKMSPEKARKFIQDYYGNDPKKMKEYFDVYTNGVGLPGNITSSGAFVADSIGGTAVSDNNVIHPNTVLTAEQNQALTDSITSYKAIISSLTEKLMEGGYTNNTIDTATPQSHVFENVINEAGLTNGVNFLLGGTDNNKTEKFTLDDGYYAVVTNKDNYVHDDSSDKCRLIIATKDVEIKKDFTGVVFAKGKVKISAGCNINSVEKVATGSNAKSELVRVLQCKLGHGGPTKENLTPLDMFIDGSSYVLAGTQITPRDDAGTVSDKVDILDTVNYKNWIKK